MNLKKIATATTGAFSALSLTATPILAQATVDGGGGQGIKGTRIRPGTGFATDIGELFNGVLSFVMVIAALLVFVYLIWGGIEWISSGGDKGKTESARNKITAAVIGLIVLAASYAILQLMLNFLGFSGGLNDVFSEVDFINAK